jgi:hypothetical protein
MVRKRELTEEEFELFCFTPEALFADYDADHVRAFWPGGLFIVTFAHACGRTAF